MANFFIQGTMLLGNDSAPWELVLSVPQSNWERFAPKPRKFFLFALGSLLGCEGVLCNYTDASTRQKVDMDDPNSGDFYFEVTLGHAGIVHPSLWRDVGFKSTLDGPQSRSGYSSAWDPDSVTSLTPSMEQAIIQRDDERCVVSNVKRGTQQAHVIPKAIPEDMLSEISGRLSGEQAEAMILDVNQINNILTLKTTIHEYFDKHWLAFLPVPNWAMRVQDVNSLGLQGNWLFPPTKQYMDSVAHQYANIERLVTLVHVTSDVDESGDIPPHGTLCRISTHSDMISDNASPPAWALALRLGWAIWNEFGVPDFKDCLQEAWRRIDDPFGGAHPSQVQEDRPGTRVTRMRARYSKQTMEPDYMDTNVVEQDHGCDPARTADQSKVLAWQQNLGQAESADAWEAPLEEDLDTQSTSYV